jgi:predicted nucleotidyltransferase
MPRGTSDDGGRSVTLEFTAVPEGGLELFDPIERHKLSFRTDRVVDPEEINNEAFDFPVDRAVSIRTGYLGLSDQQSLYVRDGSGSTVTSVAAFESETLPEGSYSVEFSTDVKLYVRVEASATLTVDEAGTHLEFGSATEVLLGARSRHERPAATIRTTTDPEDVMVAVSYFGSALKTTSPERSFPSLRGHPPLVESGAELSVPADLDRPDTGVTIEVPRDLGAVYVVAPLAYYLGAEVTPAEEPCLRTDAGWEYALDGPRGVEETVARTLKQVFFLDCVTRTEGLYDFDLHERDVLEAAVDLPFADLYASPLSERLEAYLAVPYAAVETHLPEWKLTSHVAPEAANVEVLPFLVDDLAVVRTPRTSELPTGGGEGATAVEEFVRDGDFTRSASDPSTVETVTPERVSSLEQAWIGEGVARGSAEPTVEAFMNRLDREPADGDIDITVVCNDTEMDDERTLVEDAYGSRAALPFDVDVHRNLTTAELREVLARPAEFFHYIGHIDEEGFDCADGKLDAGEVEDVGVDAFFLNACRSYWQGHRLIETGSIGGVVTQSKVVNSGAVDVGCTLARLLNYGFTLRSGLEVASGESVIGGQYSVVGDGGLSIAQAPGGTPKLFEVTETEEGYLLDIRCYPNSYAGMGALITPHFKTREKHFLNSGQIAQFELTSQELRDFLSLEENAPIRFDGQLYWSVQSEDREFLG